MKIRINITIEEGLYSEIKKYIYNVSKFCNKCLERQVAKEKAKAIDLSKPQLKEDDLQELLNEIGDN